MYESEEKEKENKSWAVSNSVVQKKSDGNKDFGFVDNRPETVAQRNSQKRAHSSPQVEQTAKFLQMADNNLYSEGLTKFRNETVNRTLDAETPLPRQTQGSLVGEPPVQRVIILDGKELTSKQSILIDETDAFGKLLEIVKETEYSMIEIFGMANDKEYNYDANNGFAKSVRQEVVPKSEKELRDEFGASSSTEVKFPRREEEYPWESEEIKKGLAPVKTLYAPIDHAVLVINPNKYRFIGTSGLIGCVEVMIEYESDSNRGYLVAHVSSNISSDEDEIKGQLSVMLAALGRHFDKEINWDEFNEDSGHARVTLVRNPGEDPGEELFINMRNILAESGAKMTVAKGSSVTMEVTADEVKYWDNPANDPNSDFRSEPDYPFK